MFEDLKNHVGTTPLVGAEIGVSVGDNAIDILGGFQFTKLYLVDSYPIYRSESTIEGQKHQKKTAVDRLKPYKDAVFIFKDSVQASEEIANESLDFVYIDANHNFENVFSDIEAWFPKIKPGGVIGGHDFDSCEDNYGVFRAIIKWSVPLNWKLNNQQSDWWVWR